MRFAIFNNNYFSQLKYDVLIESALNEFITLNESDATNILNGLSNNQYFKFGGRLK